MSASLMFAYSSLLIYTATSIALIQNYVQMRSIFDNYTNKKKKQQCWKLEFRPMNNVNKYLQVNANITHKRDLTTEI